MKRGTILCLIVLLTLLSCYIYQEKTSVFSQWKGENIFGSDFFSEQELRKKVKEDFIEKCSSQYYKDITPVDDNLSLRAKSALLLDGTTKRVLYEKDGYKKMPMASTTKIMTCLYVIENSNLEDIVTISENAVKQPKVRYGLQAGEQYQLKELLYALMLESYNDVAVAIAEHVSHTVEEFCKGMTGRAQELNCYNTSFETPNGLDSSNHYTTACDLCIITSYALSNATFREIIATPTYTVTEISKGRKKECRNKNRFLTMYLGAIGAKTGFTGNAGYCFVGGVEQDGRQFISAVLACGWPPDKNLKWKDTKTLMDYGVGQFQNRVLMDEQMEDFELPLRNGKKKKVKVTFEKNVSYLLKADDVVSYKMCLLEGIEAPLKKEQNVGKIRIYVNQAMIKEIKINTKEKVEKRDFLWCLSKIIKLFSL